MGKKNKGKRDPEKIEEARALFEEATKDTQKMELTLMELLVTRDYKKHIVRLSVARRAVCGNPTETLTGTGIRGILFRNPGARILQGDDPTCFWRWARARLTSRGTARRQDVFTQEKRAK